MPILSGKITKNSEGHKRTAAYREEYAEWKKNRIFAALFKQFNIQWLTDT